ncbi:hypothetical protein BDQ12DRAFT_753342 [Crucibulum laeve]|uniref:Novel STAND NTPase 1 domain-containing protein n=1 Tax=Crucibulum laeve TaxID=68775 RepID=A0A5C3LWS4_9AGAR|nr:hypothetical protein BDQ12DRAFT_753342 [Crucibulum laeve]
MLRAQRAQQLKSPSKIEDLLQYGAIAARMLKEIAEATGLPYLKTIAGLTTSIIQTVQTVRYNKDECIRMTEHTYWLICAIINICKNTEAELPLDMVRNIEQFQETVQKLLSYVRMHVDAIQHALDVFGVQSHVITTITLAEMQEHAFRRHQELMDVLSSKQAALPPGTTLEDLRRSSSTLSLLPASPLIFTGRDKEQQEIITMMKNNTAARIVVLGPGGIGKTSLTLFVLHDHNIVDIFCTRRYFISCDAAITADGLVSTIAKYFNLEEKPKLSNAIIGYLNRSKEPALMVLDNFETPWEIPEHKSKVESFLALLANISHLSIVLTMRGVERPGKIRWTRPFLAPLEPLTDEAAEEIFRDIADINDDDPGIMELLKLTDNLPLAVTLMAHLAESETCANILSRWKEENTSLLSDGVDKISSLEKSISMSISSPRMKNIPDALELLSLLALLPDGISEATLLDMSLPFDNVPKCRFILVSTSLAYVDGRGRVKALTPIRKYTRIYHPLRNQSLQSLNAYVNQILDVSTANCEYPSQHQIDAISNELGNIYSILDYNLQIAQNYADNNFQTVKTVISLFRLMDWMAMGSMDFLLSLSSIVEQLGNQKLLQGQILYYLGAFSERYTTSRDAEKDLKDAYDCFESVGALNGQILVTISLSYLEEDPIKASNIARKAVSMTTHGSLEINNQRLYQERLAAQKANSSAFLFASKLLQIILSEYHHDTLPHAILLHNLIEVDIATGRIADPQVQRNLKKLESMAELLPSYWSRYSDILPWNRSQIYLHNGDLENAALQCLQSLSGTPSHWRADKDRPQRLHLLGHIHLRQGQEDQAMNIYILSLVIAQKLQHKPYIHQAIRGIGDVFIAMDDIDTATSLFEIALEGFTELDVHRGKGECMIRLGDIAHRQGELGKTRNLWTDAIPLFKKSEQGKEVIKCENRLQMLET